ncbi:uncharacterized protein LOC123689070 isoform X2 [Harmonia axyridis]|uniref:uncharacterized protein LOC123689070 isoform X2 n=1 Tax=Harmonia axyridis TaxID=115357 RepID=UPI001E279AE0|nr:uncharacterized protein LOC123689070 isoform X2 [Harmonia axyridis]
MAKMGFIQTIPGEVLLDDDYPIETITNIAPPFPDVKGANHENDEYKENLEEYVKCVKEGSYYSLRDPRFLLPGEYYIIEKGDSFEILEDIKRDGNTMEVEKLIKAYDCGEKSKTDLVPDDVIFKKPWPVSKTKVLKKKMKKTQKKTDPVSKVATPSKTSHVSKVVTPSKTRNFETSNAQCSTGPSKKSKRRSLFNPDLFEFTKDFTELFGKNLE